MNDNSMRRRALRLLLAWAALIALMLASLASAYVPLGTGNLAVGLGIAAIKVAVVAAVFMGLLREPALVRLVAGFALGLWLVLAGLSGVDYATRPQAPAAWQGSGR